MAYINRWDGYHSFPPVDEHVLGGFQSNAPQQRAGLFYRADLIPDTGQIAEKLVSDPETCSLDEYQYWVESGWKTEHGTFDSVRRFGDKLREEQGELFEVVRAREIGRTIMEMPDLRDRGIHELGDVLWPLVALTSNSSTSIDHGLKNALYRYVMGVRVIGPNGNDDEPVWRPLAAQLATKFDGLTVEDVDALIDADFEPLFAYVMNIDDDGHEFGSYEHLSMLDGELASMRAVAEAQYGYGEEESYVTADFFREKIEVMGELSGRSILNIAFIAKHLLGTTLSEVIKQNVIKINGRIALGLVDKSDGERPDGV